MLLLDLVHEIKVSLVEMVNPDVTVFAPAGVASPRGVDGDGVQRTEMAFDASDLVLEDSVVKAGLEFALPGRCGRDIGGGLPAAEDHKVFFRRDGGG